MNIQDIQWNWLLIGAASFFILEMLVRSWFRRRRFISIFGVSKRGLTGEDVERELRQRWSFLKRCEDEFHDYVRSHYEKDMVNAYHEDISRAEDALVKAINLAEAAGFPISVRKFLRQNRHHQNHQPQKRRSYGHKSAAAA